jgi:hypothetical protein
VETERRKDAKTGKERIFSDRFPIALCFTYPQNYQIDKEIIIKMTGFHNSTYSETAYSIKIWTL